MSTLFLSLLFGCGLWLCTDYVGEVPRLAHTLFLRSRRRLSVNNSLTPIAVGSAGAAAASLVGGLMFHSLAILPVVAVGGAVIAVLSQQQQIQSRAKQLHLLQSVAMPAFIDMLCICVMSGMPLRNAVRTIAIDAHPLVRQGWQALLGDEEFSIGLAAQLDLVVRQDPQSVNARVANTLVIATERGTSLVEVLRGLSDEIRAETRRDLLEIAAKKDVQMMLPVVFGILPSVVAIALYPALGALSSLT